MPFLIIDRRHWTISKSTGKSKNSDKGHCRFLNSPGDIGLFQNRKENLKIVTFLKIDRGHWGPPIKGPRNTNVACLCRFTFPLFPVEFNKWQCHMSLSCLAQVQVGLLNLRNGHVALSIMGVKGHTPAQPPPSLPFLHTHLDPPSRPFYDKRDKLDNVTA